MMLFPFGRSSFYTSLTPHAVKAILNEQLETRQWFRWPDFLPRHDIKPFEGKAEGNSFRFNEIRVGRRNTFRPEVQGKVSMEKERTKVDVKMLPHWVTLIFLVVWIGFIGNLALASWSDVTSVNLNLAKFIPIGILVAAYLWVMHSLRMATQRAMRFMMDHLQLEEIPKKEK